MNLSEAIQWKYPNAQAECNLDTNQIMSWDDVLPQPDEAVVMAEYQAWINSGGMADQMADIETQFDEPLKAFAKVMLDEINILRTNAGLPERTIQQLKNAVKAKM